MFSLAENEMLPAPYPSNEADRIKALQTLNILDSEPEIWFTELAELASSICETPIATISLVDEKRQWFKAYIGLDVSETSRAVSFCGHTILQKDTMEVLDTLKDARFEKNPLVLGGPGIRFYAGAPLVTSDGYPVGALCVMDTHPKRLNEAQHQALRILADQVEMLLEMRRALLHVRNRARILATSLNASQYFKLTLTLSGKVVSANQTAPGALPDIFDLLPMPGQSLVTILKPAYQAYAQAGIQAAKNGGAYTRNMIVSNADGSSRELEISLTPSNHQDQDGSALLSFVVDNLHQRDSALRQAAGQNQRLRELVAYQGEQIQGPVSAIYSAALQLDDSSLSPANSQLLTQIRQSARSLRRTLDASELAGHVQALA